MKLIRLFVTFFALGPQYSAFAGQPASSPNVPASVFDHVLAFGASVTHATPAVLPFYDNFTRAAESLAMANGDYELPAGFDPSAQRPWGLSPVRYLVKHYRGKAGLKNITYVSSLITNGDEDAGSGQIERFLNGEQRALFDAATVVVGIDAFYWDAVYNNCQANDFNLKDRIVALIDEARAAGKVLILGNVPEEDASKVRIDSERTGMNGWWAPNPLCAKNISSLLESRCKVANGCYIVDLRGTVERLNAGEKLPLADGGHYGLFEMRPDGVHLSDKGTRYLAELAIKQLERAPISLRPAGPMATAR